MSPQALRQQGHTEKGDVWAVGIMLFEMLFGITDLMKDAHPTMHNQKRL